MRKSRILTFVCPLASASQMYLGYMKRGVSLMGIFCLLISITRLLNLSFCSSCCRSSGSTLF